MVGDRLKEQSGQGLHRNVPLPRVAIQFKKTNFRNVGNYAFGATAKAFRTAQLYFHYAAHGADAAGCRSNGLCDLRRAKSIVGERFYFNQVCFGEDLRWSHFTSPLNYSYPVSRIFLFRRLASRRLIMLRHRLQVTSSTRMVTGPSVGGSENSD